NSFRIGEVKQHMTNLAQLVPHQQYYRLFRDANLNDFHISLEEFLHSFITLTNELSRLAINSVTVGDYNRPIRISIF
ncbi:3713_t:CDS:2, partial [Gigaspora rosea]